MSNFSTIKSELADELHEPSDSSIIARYMVSSLRYLRPFRFIFSENATTITLASGTATYARGGGVVPADLLSIDSLGRQSGGQLGTIMTPVSIGQFRAAEAGGIATSGQPDIYTWYEQSLHVWPTPGENYVLNLDYMIDATRDSATGDVITTSDTTETNNFFTEGAELLKTRVIYTYAMMRSHDDGMIPRAKTLFNEIFRAFLKERDLLKIKGRQAVNYWGGI